MNSEEESLKNSKNHFFRDRYKLSALYFNAKNFIFLKKVAAKNDKKSPEPLKKSLEKSSLKLANKLKTLEKRFLQAESLKLQRRITSEHQKKINIQIEEQIQTLNKKKTLFLKLLNYLRLQINAFLHFIRTMLKLYLLKMKLLKKLRAYYLYKKMKHRIAVRRRREKEMLKLDEEEIMQKEHRNIGATTEHRAHNTPEVHEQLLTQFKMIDDKINIYRNKLKINLPNAESLAYQNNAIAEPLIFNMKQETATTRNMPEYDFISAKMRL